MLSAQVDTGADAAETQKSRPEHNVLYTGEEMEEHGWSRADMQLVQYGDRPYYINIDLGGNSPKRSRSTANTTNISSPSTANKTATTAMKTISAKSSPVTGRLTSMRHRMSTPEQKALMALTRRKQALQDRHRQLRQLQHSTTKHGPLPELISKWRGALHAVLDALIQHLPTPVSRPKLLNSLGIEWRHLDLSDIESDIASDIESDGDRYRCDQLDSGDEDDLDCDGE